MTNYNVTAGPWKISAVLDDDGHLSLYVTHEDGTTIADTGADIASSETEWAVRLTSDGTERKFLAGGNLP